MPGPYAVDLRTTYLGLELSSPIVASASPLTGKLDGAKALAEAGAGAIVLPSLFEEEIVAEEVNLSAALEVGSEHFAEALDYFPAVTGSPARSTGTSSTWSTPRRPSRSRSSPA